MWGDQDSRQARNQSRAKARRRLPRWRRGRELGWLLNKAWGAFSKVSLLGINHFFFLREYSVLNKGEIQNRQVGASVWHVMQGPLHVLRKAGVGTWGGKGTVMSLHRRALPEKSKTSMPQTPGSPGAWPASGKPPSPEG